MAEGYTPPKDDLDDIIKKMESHLRTEDHRLGRRAELSPTDQLRHYHRTEKVRILAKLKIERVMFANNLTDNMCSSKTPFNTLERTTIPHLRLDESAERNYLLLQILEEGYEYFGFHTVVEDHQGNVCCLVINNLPLEELTDSVGCALIIKEPYYQLNVDKFPLLRCDCPTDILVLRPTVPLYNLALEIKWVNNLEGENIIDVLLGNAAAESPKQWYAWGDQLRLRKRLTAAREAYRIGLCFCQRGDAITKELGIQLLLLHFSLEYYEWSTIYCIDILKDFPDDRDALYYLGIGYCFQKNFQKGLNTFNKHLEQLPGNEATKSSLSDVNNRILEAKGTFNIERLRSESKNSPFEPLACADYDGFIDITPIPGKGRGLVLTKDVKKDDILIVSKAVVAFFLHKNPELLIGCSNKDKCDLMSSENLKKLTHLIYKNPDLIGAPVFNLFAGEHPFQPVQQFCYPNEKREPICDVMAIRSIYECNKFLITEKETVNSEVLVKGEGLFLMPSYLNHNCTPNVDIEFFNDIMVVTAKMNLRKGSELVFSYVPLDTEPAKKKELLQQRGIQMCRCNDCKQERRRPRQRR